MSKLNQQYMEAQIDKMGIPATTFIHILTHRARDKGV